MMAAIGTNRTSQLHYANVRSQGQSGNHMLALSFSDYDPKADVALNRFTRLGAPDRFVKLHQIGALPSPVKQ
jgi:hypothetical protein